MKIPIAIADDHSVVRKGLIDYINSWEDCEVVLDAHDGKALLNGLEHAATFPEICILDINMPVMNGFDTCGELKKKWPFMKVLVMSVFLSEFTAIKMINQGANGFLSKDCDPDELHKALQDINSKDYYYTQFIPEKIFAKAKDSHLLKITHREMEFLNLCCSDMAYKTIADKMGISIRTIESYRDSLYSKLNVRSRMGLMLFALKTGIVSQDTL